MIAPPFDLRRLYQEISTERQRQDLSWSALSRQVRVAASTIRRYAHADAAVGLRAVAAGVAAAA